MPDVAPPRSRAVYRQPVRKLDGRRDLRGFLQSPQSLGFFKKSVRQKPPQEETAAGETREDSPLGRRDICDLRPCLLRGVELRNAFLVSRDPGKNQSEDSAELGEVSKTAACTQDEAAAPARGNMPLQARKLRCAARAQVAPAKPTMP
ncbi:UNVERIFIED_CONTAM: hypothetical protein HHA_454320 [Hammondia hammondi]|eukprot:XP_008887822.1 hypothetical protein HHA_454320 [Hammondia hammondi]